MKKRLFSFVMSLLFMFNVTMPVLADTITYSGDDLSIQGNKTTIELGEIAKGTTEYTTVSVLIQRQGPVGSDQHKVFKSGSEVEINVENIDTNLVPIISSETIIQIPDDWTAVNSGKTAEEVFSLSFSPQPDAVATAQTISNKIKLTATGISAKDGSKISIEKEVNVIYKVVNPTNSDTVAPVITHPEDMSVEATNAQGAIVKFGVTANDNVDGEVTVTCSPASGSIFPFGTTEVTCSATDKAGNSATKNFTVTVVDTTKPVFTLVPENKTVEAAAEFTIVDIGTANANDIFPLSITHNAHEYLANGFPIGVTTIIWTAKDINGNEEQKTQLITITDSKGPEFTKLPIPITIEATDELTPVTAEKLGEVTAFDISGIKRIENDAPPVFKLGKTLVVWTAEDIYGNKSYANQSVTIIDTKVDKLVVPADITDYEATAVKTQLALGSPEVDDIFGIASLTNNAPAEGFGLGTTEVTWTAVDNNGNKRTAVQLVTVVDTKVDELVVPTDITNFEATGVKTPVALGTPEVNDIFGIASLTNNAPAEGFGLGTTEVTWTAVDNNGNKRTAVQSVTIVDSKVDKLVVPADITDYEATAVKTQVALGSPEVDDIFGIASLTNNAPAEGFGLGTTEVTWTAVDNNGNKRTAVQSVTIVDTKVDELVVPADITDYEATAVKTQVALGSPEVDDIFGIASLTNNAPAEGFGLGTTEVTWTAVDNNGNKRTAVQSVTIVDTKVNRLTVPADVYKKATGIYTPVTADELGTACAYDIFGIKSITNNAPATFPAGTTEVVWTAIDNHGNTIKRIQYVTIEYDFTGFFSPVDMGDKVVNIVKAGSAVPIKFSLNGNMGLDIFAVNYPKVVDATFTADVNYDEIDSIVAASNSGLSYDPTTKQYTYVWKTEKSLVGKSAKLVIKFNDGTTHTANFKFK